MPKLNREAAKEKFWRNAIARQIESGLSQSQFCDREKLRPTTFSSWKMAIQQRDANRKQPPNQAPAFALKQTEVSSFIPVVVSGTNHSLGSSERQAVAELRFGHNLVSIFTGADIETLRALFSACKECFE